MKCGMRTFENLTNVYTKRSKVSMCVGVCICASTQNDIVQSNSTYTHTAYSILFHYDWKRNGRNFAILLFDSTNSVQFYHWKHWTMYAVSGEHWTVDSLRLKTAHSQRLASVTIVSTWVSLVLWVISVLKTSRQLHYKASVHKHQIKSWPISERIR